MSLSKSAAASGDGSSRACPAACGALIAAKDLHPFCVVCLGLKHAEEALQKPENCSHCLRLPKKLLRRRLKVAATLCAEFGLSDSDGGHGEDDAPPEASRGAASLDWADQPNPTRHLRGQPPVRRRTTGSADDDDVGLLGVSEDEEAIPPSYVPQANAPAALPQSILLDVCERAAARLNIEWPAPQSATDQERDVYDGPRKQLFPVLPVCAKHMRHYWSDPLNLKHGLVGLEVKDMAVLGMGDPPAIEPSIARHLNPVQGWLLAPPKPFTRPHTNPRPCLSGRLTFPLFSPRTRRSFWTTWLMTSFSGMRARPSKPAGVPWRFLWWESALWLNLSGLPDSEKRRIAGAPVESGQALFGPAVALMQQRCDDKKEDEAFKLQLHVRCPLRVCLIPRPRDDISSRARIDPAADTLHGRVTHPLQRHRVDRLPPRPRPGNLLILPPPTQNASGRSDVRPLGALSLCSRATSLSDSRLAPEPPFKRRRVSFGRVGHLPLEAVQPICSVDVVCSPPRSGGLLLRPMCSPTQNTQKTINITNHMNSFQEGRISLQKENISPQGERISLERCMSPPVSPLDAAIAPHMSEQAELAALSSSTIRVGTLANHVIAWMSVSAPEWVIHTITRGYRLQFAERPPRFNGVISSHTEESSAHILKDEILSGAEFCHDARALDTRARSLIHELPLTIQGRSKGTVSHMSQTTGSYGFGCPCPASRSSENEGVHEVGFISSFQPITRSLPLCHSDAYLHGSAAPLEECRVLHSGNRPQGHQVTKGGNDRRILNRMGSHSGGQNSERCVDWHTPVSPHKLFGAPHGLEGFETFSAPPAGASRAGAVRQHHSCGTYQPPRGDALLQASCSSSQAASMEQAALSVITGDPCPGHFKQRRRPFVEGEPTLRRMAPPSSDSGSAMGEVRSGCRRSLHLA
ncbi:Actin cytoskeleton-regulatory complex protein end3 [Labeo rohita]|uniref:Actin cytoskeleton-regulatory complex protein end3 n=1 Tax=Labeo rohita TaxID=84645 RepID=A0ABQ8MMT4_LABRO|nr:Actin cytoskeleton-regulatory complex protein end3 [Labeo rohita]